MDAAILRASLLKAREATITAGAFKFTVRRPTEMQLTKTAVRGEAANAGHVEINLEMLKDCVIGWEDVKESDIVGSNGSSDPVPFEPALYRDWIEDQGDLWPEMIKGIQEVILSQTKRKEAEAGN